ncbi:hypothetical protein DRE_07621 [Drechslerella stenobrocha 248]|uniref:Uncharacterized protein n=1 Tax=Drechslerella stenobrocha 248 TaxID=1043628 RepID=W7I3X7_9PEZI|nr:hypothetical protein DRE_07621 [Drechslerella stenobrocha 248]
MEAMPLEIAELIVGNKVLSMKDRAVLSRTSKWLNAIANRILYKTFQVHWGTKTNVAKIKSVNSFIKNAEHVREFFVYFDSRVVIWDEFDVKGLSDFVQLIRAFPFITKVWIFNNVLVGVERVLYLIAEFLVSHPMLVELKLRYNYRDFSTETNFELAEEVLSRGVVAKLQKLDIRVQPALTDGSEDECGFVAFEAMMRLFHGATDEIQSFSLSSSKGYGEGGLCETEEFLVEARDGKHDVKFWELPKVKEMALFSSGGLQGPLLSFNTNCFRNVRKYEGLWRGPDPVDIEVVAEHLAAFPNLEELVVVEHRQWFDFDGLFAGVKNPISKSLSVEDCFKIGLLAIRDMELAFERFEELYAQNLKFLADRLPRLEHALWRCEYDDGLEIEHAVKRYGRGEAQVVRVGEKLKYAFYDRICEAIEAADFLSKMDGEEMSFAYNGCISGGECGFDPVYRSLWVCRCRD